MIFIAVRRWRIVMAAMFSIAAVVLNMLTLQYLHADNLGIVDMSSLTGKKIMLDPGHGGTSCQGSGVSFFSQCGTIADKSANCKSLLQKQQMTLRTRDSLKKLQMQGTARLAQCRVQHRYASKQTQS